MTDKYVLRGREAVPCDDLLEWGREFGKTDRRVAQDVIGDARISTVFLGLDHSFWGGPPLIFETMIFEDGSDLDQWQERCSTWDEAEAMHAKACELVRSAHKSS